MVAPVDPKILLMDGPFGAIDTHTKTSSCSRPSPARQGRKGYRGYPEALSWPFTARTTCSCPHSITRLTGMPWIVLDTMSGRM